MIIKKILVSCLIIFAVVPSFAMHSEKSDSLLDKIKSGQSRCVQTVKANPGKSFLAVVALGAAAVLIKKSQQDDKSNSVPVLRAERQNRFAENLGSFDDILQKFSNFWTKESPSYADLLEFVTRLRNIQDEDEVVAIQEDLFKQFCYLPIASNGIANQGSERIVDSALSLISAKLRAVKIKLLEY